MVYSGIWKDTYYTTSANTLTYTINLDGVAVFSGKAYKMPGQSDIKININKICQDYLYQDLDSVLSGSTSQTNDKACRDFILKDAEGTELERYRFLYCWDYGYTWSRSTATNLSVPITGEYAANMYKLKTTVSTGNTTTPNTVTTHKNTGSYPKLSCGSFAIYYTNLMGGWDAFLFTEKCHRTDSIKQYTYNRAFDNNTREFETGRYISEITESYELQTGILTEEQAALFAKHLIGSNKCYLHNLDEGWVKPCVITDKEAKFKLDGDDSVITYSIKVSLSQSRIRQ